MLSSKQRAYLKGLAINEDTILQVGKNGVIDTLLTQVKDALTARELIKLKVLENCPLSAHEAARVLADKSNSDIVQVIGGKFVLYKENSEDKKITLPKVPRKA